MYQIIFTVLAIILGSVGFYFLSKYVLIKQSPMVLNILKVVFVGLIVLIAYMNYNSIESKISLTENVKTRKKAVQQRLEQIRDAQVQYKKVRGVYAANFESLIDFLENDSIPVIFMDGEVPDSLIGREAEALALGIITRDTTQTPVKELLFIGNFNSILDSLIFIPFSGGKQFNIDAGMIHKNKMDIPVFMASAKYTLIYLGLQTDNEGYDMTDSLMIGSMEEATTNGNWND
ncbi:MAG: hypothetical protein JKX68_04695 [Flavobacteriales bacterium]|nr:hypothetical protein [Flavobacteriales bacterium]